MVKRIDLASGRRASGRRALALVALATAVTAFQLVIRPATRASASAVAASPAYTIDDLGVFQDGGGATLATGINAAGDVSGYGNHGTPGYTAFRWSNGTLTDLGWLGCDAHGQAINDSDVVVGYSNVTCAESDKAGFQTTQNGLQDIGNLPGGSRPTVAYAINANGQIVGSSITANGTGRAFISGPGGIGLQQVDNLGTEPPGAQTLEGHGVNSQGDVVGIAFFFDQTCGSHDSPFLFSGGTIIELSGLGGCSGQANAINDGGVVVGYEGAADGFAHAFKWDGTIHDLGVPTGTVSSQALAINRNGTIVGSALASQLATPQAWVYEASGGMRLLTDLLDPSLGWNLQVATGINDRGQIAGYGGHNGLLHAFRLTPVVNRTLTSLAVTPANLTIPTGFGQQFTATGTFSDGSSSDLTSSVRWSSSKPKVATISSSGQLSTQAPGTTVVAAAAGSVSGSTTVKVGPAKLVSIAISPLDPTVSVGATQQFAGSGTYSDGRVVDLTTKGAWFSSDHKVATIGLHTGLATTKKTGSSTIKFQAGPYIVTTVLGVGPGGTG